MTLAERYELPELWGRAANALQDRNRGAAKMLNASMSAVEELHYLAALDLEALSTSPMPPNYGVIARAHARAAACAAISCVDTCSSAILRVWPNGRNKPTDYEWSFDHIRKSAPAGWAEWVTPIASEYDILVEFRHHFIHRAFVTNVGSVGVQTTLKFFEADATKEETAAAESVGCRAIVERSRDLATTAYEAAIDRIVRVLKVPPMR